MLYQLSYLGVINLAKVDTGGVIGRSPRVVQRFTPASHDARSDRGSTTRFGDGIAQAAKQGGVTSMSGAPIVRDLDLRGLKCPMPVLRTRRALSGLPVGTRLDVTCTDPLAVIDLPHLLRETGDTLLASGSEDGVWRFSILKA